MFAAPRAPPLARAAAAPPSSPPTCLAAGAWPLARLGDHRRRRARSALLPTPTPPPRRCAPAAHHVAAAAHNNNNNSASSYSSTASSFEDDASTTDESAPAATTTTISLSPRALEVAAEAAATSASASASAESGAPPPAGYRFAAACISAADETLGACAVADSDDDDDVEEIEAATAARGGRSSRLAAAAAAAAPPASLQQQRRPATPASAPAPQPQPQPSSPQQRARQRALLQWAEGGPRRCLIVKKPGVAATRQKLVEIANWLAERGVACFVERSVHASELPGLPPFDPRSTAVDFAITLGGDGTVLHLASMFGEGVGVESRNGDNRNRNVVESPLPPVVCFAMGTLGFLTAFSADEFAPCLERVLAGDREPLYCTLRSRTRVEVLLPADDDDEDAGDGGSSMDNADSSSSETTANGRRRRPRRPAVRSALTRYVLNECVVDRGAFPHAVYIEIFVDGAFVTAAEADGLVVATPSGSTAYSMSAGGPMVSPSVPCTLLTPLSPQSLSFRPLVIPESSELLISVPRYARSHARLSFDGRSGQRLPRGSALRVSTSACPLPFINLKPLDGDFYEAIVEKLRWNTLIRGRAGERPVPPMVVVNNNV